MCSFLVPDTGARNSRTWFRSPVHHRQTTTHCWSLLQATNTAACPLLLFPPQPVEADGRQHWAWFCWTFISPLLILKLYLNWISIFIKENMQTPQKGTIQLKSAESSREKEAGKDTGSVSEFTGALVTSPECSRWPFTVFSCVCVCVCDSLWDSQTCTWLFMPRMARDSHWLTHKHTPERQVHTQLLVLEHLQ